MYENGAIYKTPDEKNIILLHLHGDVFCLLEVVNGKLNVVRAEKWEYSRSELPPRLEEYEFVEGGSVSIETPRPIFKVEPKPERKTNVSDIPSRKRR
jgi:hypothetical protein